MVRTYCCRGGDTEGRPHPMPAKLWSNILRRPLGTKHCKGAKLKKRSLAHPCIFRSAPHQHWLSYCRLGKRDFCHRRTRTMQGMRSRPQPFSSRTCFTFLRQHRPDLRRRSRPHPAPSNAAAAPRPATARLGCFQRGIDGGGGNLFDEGLGWNGVIGNGRLPCSNSNANCRIAFCSVSMLTQPCGA
jgi:hypothetical protein